MPMQDHQQDNQKSLSNDSTGANKTEVARHIHLLKYRIAHVIELFLKMQNSTW